MNNNIWILVADGFTGRFFKVDDDKSLIEVKTMTNPEDRLQDREFLSDAYGRSGVNTYTDRRKETDYVRDSFARDICHELEKYRKEGSLKKLHILAGPHFLGLLRKHMGKPLYRCVQSEIKSDVARESTESIRKLLPDRL